MRLLEAFATAALALVAGASAAGCPRTGEPPIIVLGAGTAGLTAGMALKANNCSALLLEARPRIGGRLHTLAAVPSRA